jgi:plastocyanin
MLNSSWKRNPAVGLLALGLLVPLAACGDDDDGDVSATDDTSEDATGGTSAGGIYGDNTAPPAGDGGGAAAGSLTIEGFSFSDTTVAAGATVSVSNEDGAAHTVTSDDDAWESVQVAGGDSGEITAPSEPGSYDLHCEIHSSMSGTLVVE